MSRPRRPSRGDVEAGRRPAPRAGVLRGDAGPPAVIIITIRTAKTAGGFLKKSSCSEPVISDFSHLVIPEWRLSVTAVFIAR